MSIYTFIPGASVEGSSPVEISG